MKVRIDDYRYGNSFKHTGLRACVDSIGEPLHMKYEGDLCFSIETDKEIVCAKLPRSCDPFTTAGFMTVLAPDIDTSGVLCHDVRVLVALRRAGLWEASGVLAPDAVPIGKEIPLPKLSVAWNAIGTEFKFRLDDKTISEICNNIVFVNMIGEFLYDPDAQFQRDEFVCSEDNLMMILMRESMHGVGYQQGNHIRVLMGYHIQRYRERVTAHKRLGALMTGDEHFGDDTIV